MELALIVGIGAFIILGVMFALLWLSSRREERNDSVTQEIIIKANTGTVNIEPVTQEVDYGPSVEHHS